MSWSFTPCVCFCLCFFFFLYAVYHALKYCCSSLPLRPLSPPPSFLLQNNMSKNSLSIKFVFFFSFFFSSLHQLNIHIHFFLRFTLIDFPLFYLRHFFFFFSPLFPLLSPPIPCTISSVYDEKILSLFFLSSFLPPLCAMFLFFLKGFFFVLRFTVRPVKKYVPTYIGSWQEKYIYMHACRKSYAGCGGMRVNAGQSVL